LFKLLDELPEGTVDAVVQGHRHTESHYFYKGIPIIGTVNGGYYLNSIRMRFTLKENKVIIDKDELYIEGPIPVCAKVFENTGKCNYLKP
jgi:5'-nucleotidase